MEIIYCRIPHSQPLITWYHYIYYGVKRILTNHFGSMKKYVDYFSIRTDNYVLPNNPYGNWDSPLEERKGGMREPTSAGDYFYITTIPSKGAEIPGYSKETQKYSALTDSTQKIFNQRYYSAGENNYDDGSPFVNAFALFPGIVPGNEMEAVLNYLVVDIMHTHKGHLRSGIPGIIYLMELLSREGRSNKAWEMTTQPSYPGWTDKLKNIKLNHF